MSNDFRIYQDGDRQIIERLSYPRFMGKLKKRYSGQTREPPKSIFDSS